METKFDKKRCLANIYYLAKERNIKIGELESKANVSAGYLSRINKGGSETNPGIELLVAVADMLSVSLDALVMCDTENLTHTEAFLEQFVEKLMRETIQHNCSWTKETAESLNKLECDGHRNVDHPLFYSDSAYSRTVRYDSHFVVDSEKGNIKVVDDCFNTRLPDGALVYLMRVYNTATKETWLEFYLVNDGNVSPLCDDKDRGLLAITLDKLYSVATESCKHIKIDSNAWGIINNYLNGTFGIADGADNNQ